MTQSLILCIGAQKAGTTWLADYMRAHPEAHTPPVKEVHFFDARFAPKWCARYEAEMLADFQRKAAALTIEICGDPAVQHVLHAMMLRFRMIANPAEYIRFMSWGARQERILFEATPDYSMLDRTGFRAMRSVHPDVRVVFLLRNPADRYWSSMTFNRTHNPDFDIDAMFDKLLTREDFTLLADYGRTLREAEAAFGPERMHVEFYERLFDQRAVDRICAFAGIAPRPADFSARSNASAPMAMPEAQRAKAYRAYAHVYADIAARFSGDVPESWRQDMERYGA
ncbi:MAG: sulfotransferase [Parvularculaceae bacterium]